MDADQQYLFENDSRDANRVCELLKHAVRGQCTVAKIDDVARKMILIEEGRSEYERVWYVHSKEKRPCSDLYRLYSSENYPYCLIDMESEEAFMEVCGGLVDGGSHVVIGGAFEKELARRQHSRLIGYIVECLSLNQSRADILKHSDQGSCYRGDFPLYAKVHAGDGIELGRLLPLAPLMHTIFLHAVHGDIIDSERLLRRTERLHTLVLVDWRGRSSVTPRPLVPFSCMSSLKHLRVLYYTSFNVTIQDEELEALGSTLSHCSCALEHVTVCGGLCDRGAHHIARGLSKNTSLRTLTLSSVNVPYFDCNQHKKNHIGNVGAIAIAVALQGNTTLQYLDLSDNNITTVPEAFMQCHPFLQLNLQGNNIKFPTVRSGSLRVSELAECYRRVHMSPNAVDLVVLGTRKVGKTTLLRALTEHAPQRPESFLGQGSALSREGVDITTVYINSHSPASSLRSVLDLIWSFFILMYRLLFTQKESVTRPKFTPSWVPPDYNPVICLSSSPSTPSSSPSTSSSSSSTSSSSPSTSSSSPPISSHSVSAPSSSSLGTFSGPSSLTFFKAVEIRPTDGVDYALPLLPSSPHSAIYIIVVCLTEDVSRIELGIRNCIHSLISVAGRSSPQGNEEERNSNIVTEANTMTDPPRVIIVGTFGEEANAALPSWLRSCVQRLQQEWVGNVHLHETVYMVNYFEWERTIPPIQLTLVNEGKRALGRV